MTGAHLSHKVLVPNNVLRSVIKESRERQVQEAAAAEAAAAEAAAATAVGGAAETAAADNSTAIADCTAKSLSQV